MRAPNGAESRILIRDTWNTEILEELAPQPGDTVIYKTRYSGFYKTDLDAVLQNLGVKSLIVTGCSTSVCVESTIRDAMFRDYSCVLLAGVCSQGGLLLEPAKDGTFFASSRARVPGQE